MFFKTTNHPHTTIKDYDGEIELKTDDKRKQVD